MAQQRDTGAAVYATHDAEEALGLADRVALLCDGELLQVGTPQQVYDEPADLFAARLTGPPRRSTPRTAPGGSSSGRGGLGSADPLEGRRGAVWFRGPHSDHLVDTPLGEVLIRAPGPPRAEAGTCWAGPSCTAGPLCRSG